MQQPTPMDPGSLRTLAALLDEALDLPAEARLTWLADLPAAAAPYREILRDMLARAEAGTEAGLIGQRPMLDDEASDFTDDLAAGQVIDGYRLVRLLGRGGMGMVWLAERTDGLVMRPVALKLPIVSMPHRMLLQRFVRERNILSALAHPHIARLYDAGISATGQPYLVMEFVQGQPITDYCNSRQMPLRQRLRLFDQVLSAVQHAHANLVVHRDIKPANIMVTEAGEVRLLDFGIAKLLATDETTPLHLRTELTRHSGSPMTLDYASPEHIRLEPVSTASDVYSLGVLLYELCAGERPYRLHGASTDQIRATVSEEARKLPSAAVTDATALHLGTRRAALVKQLRGDLDTVILKALKPQVADRYPSAEALAADLQRWRDGEPVRARPVSQWYRALRYVQRNRVAVGLSGLVAVSLIAGSVLALWQAQVARTQTQAALATESFLTGLFIANSVEQANPLLAQQTTARELLDRGSQQVLTSLNDAPEAKLRILKTLAGLTRSLGLNEQAYKLSQQRLAMLRAIPGRRRAEIVAEILDTSNDAYMTSTNVSQAATYLQEAQGLLDAMGDNSSALRGRLELLWANQMLADNCMAAKHATRGVELLRPFGQSNELTEGLLQMALNMSHCNQVEEALVASSEAIQRILQSGPKAQLPAAYRVQASAYVGLGKFDLAIARARQALDATLALHPNGTTPNADMLYAGASLAVKLVGLAHPVEALAVTQPLVQRALADMEHTDRDGLISVLIHEAKAQQMLGHADAAQATIQRTHNLLSTFNPDDGQRVMVLDAMAFIKTEARQFDAAKKALDEAAQLHAKLHHTGTGQANQHIAWRVLFQLRKGDPQQAAQELAAFGFRPYVSGTASRPQLEHAVMQAEVAQALHQWDACIAAAEQVHAWVRQHPLPEYVRDLHARAWQAQSAALAAQGHKQEARAALQEAAAIRSAMLAVPDAQQISSRKS